jgi:hypothetical protein
MLFPPVLTSLLLAAPDVAVVSCTAGSPGPSVHVVHSEPEFVNF